MVIDGVEVSFQPQEDGTVAVSVLPEGRLIGRLRLTDDATSFRAETADGRVLQQASPWGGTVSAKYRTKDLAVRALLEAQGSPHRKQG